MKINEIDWKHSSLERIFAAISVSLNDVQAELGFEDVDEALEQSDGLLGTAFVAAQVYISGTVNDASKLSSTLPSKRKLLEDYSDVIPGTGITQMRLCDAIANYYKHQDEWPDWTPGTATHKDRQRKDTIDCLAAVGVVESTPNRCVAGLQALLGLSSADLGALFSIIVEWRKKVIAAYK